MSHAISLLSFPLLSTAHYYFFIFAENIAMVMQMQYSVLGGVF